MFVVICLLLGLVVKQIEYCDVLHSGVEYAPERAGVENSRQRYQRKGDR